jgi:regulator of protease activity HflC (stomatin/prohibitin superfamily)
MLIETVGGVGIFIAIVVIYFLSCIRFIFEFERGVVFRLGRVLPKPKGPGVILVFNMHLTL